MRIVLRIPQEPFLRLRNESAADRIPKIGNLLVFWLVLSLSVLAESGAVMLFRAIRAGVTGETEMPALVQLYLLLYLTLLTTAACYAYCRFAEKRSNASLGITKKHLLPKYIGGLLLGTAMLAATVLLSTGFGGMRYEGTAGSVPVGSMTALVIGWMLQGFSEELSFRGYLMMTVGVHSKPLTAVSVSALFFAAAHLFNDGISPLACCNLFLYGVLMSMLFLRSRSIWLPAGLHSAWNWAQGNLFGIKVSGIDCGVTVFRFAQNDGQTLLNGGAFGIEGSIFLTGLLVVGILLTALTTEPKKS